ncbi:dihydrodipicolinate synthase family protein [Cryobacterium sp. TMT2-42-4]|uniref:dihydrodipicolinate synthase family protein n=1 Tax=Cryobacterium sp. TMT2-42-4 TaxID=1259255 RepID=UPI0024111020|nr:dihydrodipicolinate synthase family protein [Cryobacterium sp. TMT2-42-4]
MFGLYEDLTAGLSVPLVVYNNPGTTHFTFSDELYARIGTLPNVTSFKIPGLPTVPDEARARVDAIRSLAPEHVTVGISGDSAAATGLNAGCEVWYSVIGGTLPALALTITRAAQAGDTAAADAESQRLQPLWEMFAAQGSLRVTATIAEHLGSFLPPRCRAPSAASTWQHARESPSSSRISTYVTDDRDDASRALRRRPSWTSESETAARHHHDEESCDRPKDKG